MRNTKLVSFSSMSEKWAVILKNCTLDHKGAIFENRSESSHISLSGFCNRKLTRVLLNRSHKALSEVSAPKYFGIFLEFQWSYKHALKPGFHDFSNSSGQFSSVAQSCLTLCDPMDCSMPGLPVHHQLPEFTDSWPLSWWCHPTISSSVIPFSSCLQSFPASGSFQMSQFFTLGGQSIGVSASALVLPMNSQNWFPSEWTGWISLQSKALSRVFSNTKVQNINSFVLSFLYSPTLTFIHDYWRNHSFD